MELVLNLAWVLLSASLIGLWLRQLRSNPAKVWAQVLALSVVILLLLPVISLSDDLLAAQQLAETDTCLRRAQDSTPHHPAVAPASFALPEPLMTDLLVLRMPSENVQPVNLSASNTFHIEVFGSRPPPRA